MGPSIRPVETVYLRASPGPLNRRQGVRTQCVFLRFYVIYPLMLPLLSATSLGANVYAAWGRFFDPLQRRYVALVKS